MGNVYTKSGALARRIYFGATLIFESLYALFRTRVLNDGGTFLEIDLPYTIDSEILLLTPNAYKVGKLYSAKPTNGTGDFTVDRNSTATYIGQDGLIKTALANVPRIDWSSGEAALLAETQKTNLITYSEAFESVAWKKGLLVISTSNLIDPEGNYQAREVTVNNGLLYAQPSGIVDGLTYTMSCWYHGTIGETLSLKYYDGTSTTIKIIILTGVWQKEDFTFLAGGGFNNVFYIDNRDDSNASVVNIWGAQFEQASTASSYIPTAGTTVTRLADNISVPTPAGVTSITETIDGVEQAPIITSAATYTIPVYNLGADLVVNGGFDTDTDWNTNEGWSIANGLAKFVDDPAYYRTLLLQPMEFKIAGTEFLLEYDVVYADADATLGYSSIANGYIYHPVTTGERIQKIILSDGAYGNLLIRSNTGDVHIDNVSVREVLSGGVNINKIVML